MKWFAVLRTLDRPQRVGVADGVAVLLAVSLPWSTSATGILALLYAIAAIPLIDLQRTDGLKAVPAAWLPIVLILLGVVGLLWADVPLAERYSGLSPFAKLIFIPLLFMHMRDSERAHWIIRGYLLAVAVLLLASLLPVVVPPLRWMWHSGFYGIPVKNYISQSDAFLIGSFTSLYLARECFQAGGRAMAAVLAGLALLFIVDILFVTTSRTALVEIPVLLILFGLWHFRWRGAVALLLSGCVVLALAWAFSPYLRSRVENVFNEIQRYEATNTKTSSGERIEFWKKSIRFIAAAPILGHGTGSIAGQFRKAVTGSSGASAEVSDNPHNQTLAVGIQLGLVGVAVLWAMWFAHLQLFRPDGLVAWFGMLVVVQNIVGSLFNSLIFDFGQGWTYVVGVGVAGGAVLRKRAAAQSVAARR